MQFVQLCCDELIYTTIKTNYSFNITESTKGVQYSRNMTNVVEFTPEFVLLLLEEGGDLDVRDYTGRTAILYAAHNDGIAPNLELLELLLERDDISRVDKIDALEMAGVVLFSNEENHGVEFSLAIRYWRLALTLRLMDTNESRPIFKTPSNSKNGVLAEWSTEEDLLRIEL